MRRFTHGRKSRLAGRGASVVCAVGLGLLAWAYVKMAPHAVQGLDAGELVAGAFNRTVVHPPGYPLWVWLVHLATNVAVYDTVFFRAAVCNIVWAVLVLTCLTGAAKARPLAWALFVAPLAVQETFWHYALLPDVFMLHGLLFACLCAAYVRLSLGAMRTWSLAALLGLGLAHHQTFVFAAPMALEGIWADPSRRRCLWALGLALGILVALYASLWAMQPQSAQAWGQLDSPARWLGHILRREYGSWQLARAQARVMPWVHWARFLRLLAHAMPLTLLFGVAAPAALLSQRRFRALVPPRLIWLWGSLTAYVLVFCIQLNHTDGRIVERFLLMPLIGYSYVALLMFDYMQRQMQPRVVVLMLACAALASSSHVVMGRRLRDLSGNTVVEDYAQNLLRMAALHSPSVLIVDGDSPLGALRYVQHVQHMQQSIAVVALTGPAGWQLRKLKRDHPDLKVPELQGRGLATSSLLTQLIQPNEPTYAFVCNTTKGLDVSRQQLVYMGLGRRLQMGFGRGVDTESIGAIVLRSRPAELGPTSLVQEDKVLFAGYAQADFVAGKFSHDDAGKQVHYMRALQRVPYCWPAAFELCLLDPSQSAADCQRTLDAHRAGDVAYF